MRCHSRFKTDIILMLGNVGTSAAILRPVTKAATRLTRLSIPSARVVRSSPVALWVLLLPRARTSNTVPGYRRFPKQCRTMVRLSDFDSGFRFHHPPPTAVPSPSFQASQPASQPAQPCGHAPDMRLLFWLSRRRRRRRRREPPVAWDLINVYYIPLVQTPPCHAYLGVQIMSCHTAWHTTEKTYPVASTGLS